MLTRDQKLLFARLVFNAKEILFSTDVTEIPIADKASKWFEILSQLNSVGASVPDYRDAQRPRVVQYAASSREKGRFTTRALPNWQPI